MHPDDAPGSRGRLAIRAYEGDGYAAQCRHLGEPVFYGTVETGDVNSYVHLWQFENAVDRDAKRDALYGDEEWQRYRAKSAEAGFQIEQRNTLLKPARFSLL